MLKYAIQHRESLARAWLKAVDMQENRYMAGISYHNFNFEIKEDDYWVLQMVSVTTDGVIKGYFTCSFNRICRKAYDIEVINFSRKSDLVFSKDLYLFLDGIFTRYGMGKVEFCVVIGNPAEAQYDRIIERYGGLVVGIKHDSLCLSDGTLCDLKMYELSRGNYMLNRRTGIDKKGRNT